jgi:hypothetical protein
LKGIVSIERTFQSLYSIVISLSAVDVFFVEQ